MINFEKLPNGDLRNTGEEYVLITPGYKRLIDVDGSFTIEEFEQILETAKAAMAQQMHVPSRMTGNPTIPGFDSLG